MKKIFSTLILSIAICSFTQAQKLDRSIRPKAGPAPAIKIGQPQTFTLPNGLKVFVVSNHRAPIVSYSLKLNVDPQMQGDEVGYIEAAGELLGTGTKTMTKEQINAAIDQIGAQFSTSSTGVYGECLTSHQNDLLKIMSDVIINAKFTQTELDKIKKKMVSTQMQAQDDVDNIMSNVEDAVDYGQKHPYGEIKTVESIKNITLDKCIAYYKSHFSPNVAYLAIVGDISLKEAEEMAKRYFSDWEKTTVPTFTYTKPQKPTTDKVFFVDKPGAVQSKVNVTYPLFLKPGDQDYVATKLATIVLGGGATSRLFQDLRETHGYTYGAYASINPDKLVGNFSAFAKVRNVVTDSSITRILAEMKKMGTTTMTAEDLQSFKNFYIGVYALSLEDPHTIAQFAFNKEIYHLPADYYANYLKAVDKVTPEQIEAVSKKYITPDKANIIVVGNKDAVMKTLTKFGKVEQLDYTGKAIKEPTAKIPKGLTAQKVIDNYIAATGGKDKLEAMKSLEMTMTASVQGQSLTIKTYKVKKHNKFAQVITMNNMVYKKMIFDGKKGYASGMMGSKEITGKALDELKEKGKMGGTTDYAKLGYKLSLEGIETIDGKDAYKIKLISPDTTTIVEYYDTKTGLKLRTVASKYVAQLKKSMTTQTDYSDYKAVKGLKFPYTITTQVGPQHIEMKVTDIKIDTKIDSSVFKHD